MPARVVGVPAMALVAPVAQELEPALAAQVPAGPEPAGPEPAGQVLAGQVLAGQVLAGQMLAGPVPAGPVPAGPVPAGPEPAGPVPAGPVPAGPEPAGQALLPHPRSTILPSSLETRRPTASLRETALAIHCWLQSTQAASTQQQLQVAQLHLRHTQITPQGCSRQPRTPSLHAQSFPTSS